MLRIFRVIGGVAVALTGLAAQSLDRLVLKQGATLVGYTTPSACGSVSFVPADGLSAQGPSISNVSTVRVGNYILDSADTSSSPTAAQIAALRALLRQKSRPLAAAPVTLSLGLTMQAICSLPPAFAGKIKIDGSATFGATVQRSIGGSILAQYTPQVQKPGAITARLRYIMSYGDTVKGDTTSKSSQIHWGQGDAHIRLHNQSASLGPTSVYLLADEYHSFSQGVRLQQSYGAGIAQDLWGSLQVQAGLSALLEDRYRPTPSFSSAAVRLYETETVFSGKKFVLTEEMETLLPTRNLEALLLRSGAELTIKLGTARPYSLNIAYDDYYFRNAPAAYKQNYSKVSVGIAYNW